ncbi:choice-of-anchor I family protein [Shewanella gaetbuli]
MGKLLPLSLIISSILLTGCNGDDGNNGTDGSDGLNALIDIQAIESGHQMCPFGGSMVTTGLDANANGVLDADEVDSAQTQYQCQPQQTELAVNLIGRYESGVFGKSAAEIVDYASLTQSAYVVNSQSGMVDVLDLSSLTATATTEPTRLNNLTKVSTIDVAADTARSGLGSVNSVSVYGDLLAMAVEKEDENGNKTQGLGIVAFYRLSATAAPALIHSVDVGALPDNLTFSPDGNTLLVANEGEPNSAYDVDPQGSVSIINITDNMPATSATSVGFTEFNVGQSRADEISSKIKINGPNASIAQDLEPEYITVSADSKTAFVSLQENNAMAVIDIENAAVSAIFPLGLKDFGLAENALDASDKDDMINLQAYEGVYGLYQPDSIASYEWNNRSFIVSANEGDARDYDGFSEEVRAEDLTLDANHPQVAAAQDKTQLGRLKVTTSMGDIDNDGDYDQIVSYGGRSFSIWTAAGQQVFDSGNDFEKITAALLGEQFNNHNEESKGDSRSDDKGPEPEALAIGTIGDVTYAFIGLERTGGFMIYDITNPFNVSFVDYIVNRDFDIEFEIDGDDISGQPELAGDLGPEGMKFVNADQSPTGAPLLIIGNEVSGSTSVYQLTSL